MSGNDVTSIPQSLQTYYTNYAAFPTTGLKVGSLAYATDNLRLYRWNGAAWQPITPDPAGFGNASISTGTYNGDDTADRAIPHGLGVVPKLVLISTSDALFLFLSSLVDQYLRFQTGASPSVGGSYVVAAKTATNFYVGDAASYTNSANASGNVYYWVAFA
jgi:hypothetical protein